MDTKHTPGPWYAANMGNDHQGLIVSEQNGANVAVSYDKSDAPLIAAAPDLLAVLSEIYQHAETYGAAPFSADKMFARARAAIAKATGGAA